MRVINVSLNELETKVLLIGFEGENQITQVRIDAAEILTDHPNATPTLIAKPLFGFAYPVIVTKEGTDVVWEIDNSVLSFHGDGEIQLTFTEGTVIAKSYVGRIRIKRSLAVTGEAPDPIETWEQAATAKLAEVDAQIGELEDMVEAAEAAKDQAQDIVDDAAADIQAAGAAQVQVVQAAGEDVLESIPSDYTELSDDVTDLKSAINDIEDEVYSKTLATASATSTGWRLKENGFCEGNSSYKMDKYQVTAGDKVFVESDHLFQFQPSASVPSGGTLNRIGETYGTGQYTLEVPENATYLIVSTLISGSSAAVYLVSGKLDDIVGKVDNLETETSAIKSDTEKTKMYGMAVRDVIGGTNRQIVDLTGLQVKSSGTSYKYYDVNSIPFTQNGDYYPNPMGECQILRVYALNASGTALKYNGGNFDSFNIDPWDKFTRIDDRTIIRTKHSNESNFKKGIASAISTYSYAEDVKFIKLQYLKNSSYSNPVDLGITYNMPLISYIPYGVDPQYNPFMFDAVWNGFVSDNKFYDVPAKRLNPWMQRSYATTNNLLDDRIFDWQGSANGQYYEMKPGEYVSVVGGKTIMCNKKMANIKWYESDFTEHVVSNRGSFTPLVLDETAAYIRFSVWRSNAIGEIPADTYEPIVLWYEEDGERLYTYDQDDGNVLPIPKAQINGWDINKNVYEYAVPDAESSIVRMMKTFSVRELNRQRNAFRIGTFNIYVNNTRTNRSTVKKELETYGLDMCCFQEARTLTDGGDQLNIGDYLKGWQFKYFNTNEVTTTGGRCMTSAYEIVSSEEIQFESQSITSNQSYLKCVIALPTYKRYPDGNTTLSFYNYHGDSTSAAARAAQVSEILAKIATDTSDFIIVAGDTNDFPDDHPTWQSFINAGFTPVHHGETQTCTDGWSIDQIFFGPNISCLYYNVIDSRDWKYKPTPTSTPIPVSDHDFLFADLQFDFETVLAARNANS